MGVWKGGRRPRDVGGCGDGEERRDPSPYLLQRFSPGRRAGLKLLEDLVLP